MNTRRSRRISSALPTFARVTEPDDSIDIPADLSTLDDEALASLSVRAQETFDTLYGEGTEAFSDADLEALAGLTEGIEALAAETVRREEEAGTRREQAAALAARVRPEQTLAQVEENPADDDEADAEDEEDEEEEPEEEPSEDTEPVEEVVTAAGRQPLSINLRGRGRTPQGRKPKTAVRTVRDIMTSTTDTLGVGQNAPIDFGDAGHMLDRRLGSFAKGSYEAAAARGQHIREQHSLLAVKREIPTSMVASGREDIEDAIKAATDQKRLPGGALTAAGWCAPSDTLYDLVYNESRDGLLSLPEIGISRGGIQIPTTPSFADIYSSIGFSFTEADAIAGAYAPGSAPVARQSSTAVTVGLVRTFPGGAIMQVTVAGTTAASAPASPLVGHTVVDGSATWVRLARVPNVVGSKPCYEVTCPEWEDYRLEGDGICITGDLIGVRGYPEIYQRITQGALVAHDHRMSANRIQKIVAGSTVVTMPAEQAGAAAPLLAAIELQSEHYKYTQRLARATVLEAVFPYWIRGAIRQDLSVRLGVSFFQISDSDIDAWFRLRGIAPQYVYDWQSLDSLADADSTTTWPSTVQFLLYEAGTWISGVDDIITLDTVYDSTLLGENKYTALFTEEASLVAKRGNDSRVVIVDICPDGSVHAGLLLECDLTESA